jgi:hypothetical protein
LREGTGRQSFGVGISGRICFSGCVAVADPGRPRFDGYGQ